MKYWVTTKWPHSIEDDRDEFHYGVYLPDGRESAAYDMRPNDIVFIYESKNGRIEKRVKDDGSFQYIKNHNGKEGIVAIVKVTSKIYEIVDSEPTKYKDGTEIWWRYAVDTDHISSNGFVPRVKLNEVLSYKPRYNLRGFGNMHSGLKEVSKEQGTELIKEFEKTEIAK